MQPVGAHPVRYGSQKILRSIGGMLTTFRKRQPRRDLFRAEYDIQVRRDLGGESIWSLCCGQTREHQKRVDSRELHGMYDLCCQ